MEQLLERELLTVHVCMHVCACARVCMCVCARVCCWACTDGHSTLTTGGGAALHSSGRHGWQNRTSSVFELADMDPVGTGGSLEPGFPVLSLAGAAEQGVLEGPNLAGRTLLCPGWQRPGGPRAQPSF